MEEFILFLVRIFGGGRFNFLFILLTAYVITELINLSSWSTGLSGGAGH